MTEETTTRGGQDAPNLRLRFGANPCHEMVVWWSTSVEVAAPRVLLGTPHTGHSRVVPAETLTYRDVVSGSVRFLHHAVLNRLRPGARYIYVATHDAPPGHEAFAVSGAFRTAEEPPERLKVTPERRLQASQRQFTPGSEPGASQREFWSEHERDGSIWGR